METLTKVGENFSKATSADTLVVQTAVTQTNGGNKSVQVLANDSDIQSPSVSVPRPPVPESKIR